MSGNRRLDASFFLLILCCALCALALGPSAASAQQLCQTALSSSGGAVVFVHDQTSITEKGVDEWDSDILKGTVTRAGLLEVSGVGPGSQARLYTGSPSAGTFRLVNVTTMGTSHRAATTVAQAQDYCFEVSPGAGATGTLALQVTYRDACLMGDPDDHGDSFSCATQVAVGDSRSGVITAGDHDMFSFVLQSSQTIVIESSGDTDLAGALFDADSALLAEDEDSGPGANFRISQTLSSGRYYVRIVRSSGTQTSYGVSFSSVP